MLKKTQVKRYFFLTLIVWTFIVCGSLAINLNGEINKTRNIAIAESRAYFNKDQAFRLWASSHGGIYVPIDETTEPNPYLSHIPDRDIVKPSGESLTLMNPAYMVRQMNEVYSDLYGINGHITSLNPLRPENAPDPWERKALLLFEKGATEVQEFTNVDGEPYLRLMRPMVTKENCLKCHSDQGYKIGDIRGGVGISLPLKPIQAIIKKNMNNITVWHLFFWILGIVGIWYGYNIMKKRVEERDLTENTLRSNEMLMSAIYKDAPLPMILVDSERRVRKINKPALKLARRPEEKVIGLRGGEVLRCIHAYDDPNGCGFGPVCNTCIVRNTVLDSFETHRNHCAIEAPIPYDNDGNVLNLVVLISTSFLEMPEEQMVLICMEDITERKQALDALRSSEENFRSLIDNIPDVIWTADQAGHITFISENIAAIYGYTPEEIYQDGEQHWLKRIHQDDIPRVKEAFDTISQDGRSFDIEYRIQRKDGQWIWLHDRAIKTYNELGKKRVDGVFTDITERKKAIHANEKLETQLRQSQKMEALGTLAGGIAHDFNNILSSVIGYTELAMMDSGKGSKIYKFLNEILIAGTRAANLVTQILTFSRKAEQECKPVLIEPIVKESLKLLRGSLPSTIEIKQTTTDCGFVMADPTQIHQLIMNLCTNAYQAMSEHGGIIEITLSEVEITDGKASSNADFKPGRYNKLTVSDTGSGMDSETQKRIFEPYFTTKEVGKGTGLGLSIVHGIVKSYDGVITVYSEPKKGTTFNIFFPVIRKIDTKILPKLSNDIKTITGTERILFVDDEEPLVSWGKAALERFGYRVTSLTSSIKALELFRENAYNFDIVITDMTMPNMIGSELARRIKEIRYDIPIILCTGFSEIVNRKELNKDLIDEYISKPIIINDLASAIRRVLDSKEKVMI